MKKQTLSNGLTVITVPIKDALSVTTLVVVHTGSKYETKEINGLSHFLEHMCFKGTKKRPSALVISAELDGMGSQSNAMTAQEFTGYYAKAHYSHLDKILDIISDIYLNSVFDEKEIEKEKGVIIGEINMYEDMPNQVVQNLFMDVMYGDQPAGWEIIGSKENVSRMTQKDFLDYRSKHYLANATTVVVSGNFDESDIVEKIEKSFDGISTGIKGEKIKTIDNQNKPVIRIKNKETDQAHLVIGLRAFSANDDRLRILRVMSIVLGGGMSSRLFQKLRDEMGVGYYIRSGTDIYTDHGLLAISAGVDSFRVSESVSAIINEMKKMKEELVPGTELQKAKDYLIGNIYLGLESSDALAEYYAIQDILSKEIKTPDQFAEQIISVTSEEIKNLANEIFVDSGLNMAIVGNIKDKKAIEDLFHF